MTPRPPLLQGLTLAGFLIVIFAGSYLAANITIPAVAGWYQTLEKPPLNPPDWLFGPVWTALYFMIAISGWRIWRITGFASSRTAFATYGAQLFLNFFWSYLFFGLNNPGLALLDIIVLWALILLTAIKFRAIDPLAGYLLVPYLAWVSFAAYLNAAIWWLNSFPLD